MERSKSRNWKSYNYRKGIKRYVRRKRKYIKKQPLTSNDCYVRCECYQSIQTVNGSNNLAFLNTSTQQNSIVTFLGTSDSFNTYSADYARYKIVGLQMRANFCVDGNNMSTLNGFVPNVAIAFYPQFTATAVGDDPIYNDSKMYLEFSNNNAVMKYLAFPDGFFTNGATGFGIWMSTQNTGSQIGQISVASAPQRVNGAAVTFANIKITVYCLFSTKIK